MPNKNPPPFVRPFGELVRHYRQLRGLSIEQVATTVGIAPSALSTIESGVRTPPTPKHVVQALANVFGLKGDDREMFELAGTWDGQFLGALGHLMPRQAREALGIGPPAANAAALPPLPASILVFLIADVRGYSRFTQDEGDAAAARLAEKFAAIARATVEHWDGRLIELRGDEALAVFASARQAVQAARDMQERFAEATAADPALPLPVGVGLDVGEPTPVEEGYRGSALNRAARLCSLAGAGEVLVSAGVAYIAPKVEGLTYTEHGRFQLKGFDEPTLVVRVTPEAPALAKPSLPAPASSPTRSSGDE
jgi:class 3 adenylate cyclase/DNA-binding XRE family transcriptional regulator